MDNAQPQPPVDTENELAVLEETVRGLQVPTHAAELIADALNFLAEHGADQQVAVLDDVYTAASQMLTTAQKLDQGFRASLAIAQTIRQQREDTRQTLADLKEAMSDVDTSVPEIDDLWQTIEEIINEENENYLYDAMHELIVDQIACDSGLEYIEAVTLLNLLTDGSIDENSDLWDELRDWMRRAAEASME